MKKNSIERLWITVIVAALMTIITILATSQPVWADGPIYVDRDALGSTHDGLSWTTAYTNVQDALTVSGSGDEIWVAQGVYTPTNVVGRSATFALPNGVALYGGFAGVESDRDARSPHLNITVLSGDLDGNDTTTLDHVVTTTTHIVGANAYHVVTTTAQSGAETTVLDGFTITAGKADGDDAPNNSGGGMYNPSNSYPVLANVTFSGNQASTFGGGMYNESSSPTLTNTTFSGNQAVSGGGMTNYLNSNPTLTNVTFSRNQANEFGGGMFNYYNCNPSLTNVTFSGNQVNQYGGGMTNYLNSNPSLTNVTFSGNQANELGGGMLNGLSNPTLDNVTFSGNQANESGGGILNYDSDPSLTNCILWDNSAPIGSQIHNQDNSVPVILYSDVQGGYLGMGNIAVDPLFADADGPDNVVGTLDDDLRPQTGSRAIDAGEESVCPATDQNGVTRPQHNGCDMGAYEYDGPVFANVYVDKTVVPTWAQPGETVTYSLKFGNWGHFTVTNTSLADSVAVSVTHPTIVSNSGAFITQTGSAPNFSWDVADLPPGQGGVITLTGTLSATLPWDNIVNTATITATGDGNSIDNESDASVHVSGILYVNHVATGTATGLSWTDAYTGLQDALTAVGKGDEIWVATGVYTPGAAAEATFRLLDDVEIYGGFVGTKTGFPGESMRAQRDWTLNVTVLSGDIDGNDVTAANSIVTDTTHITGTNTYHIVTSAWVGSTAVLDGFTITAGKADDDDGGAFDNSGGGMYNTSGNPRLANLTFSGNQANEWGGGMFNDSSSNPSLTNVTFSGNQANSDGGGMHNDSGSNPSLTNVTFSGNQANGSGGGMHNESNSNPSLTNVTFSGNQANGSGGGMYNYSSSPSLTNVTFSGNQTNNYGGGMSNSSSSPSLSNVTFSGNQANSGGGMSNSSSTPSLANVTFSGNQANSGGGMYNSSSSNPSLTNVTFSGNQASGSGGGMYNWNSSTLSLTNCILWGNTANPGAQMHNSSSTPVINYSLIAGGCPAGATCDEHLLTQDPQFVAPLAASAAPTTTGDYRLRDDSPAIDAGDNTAVPTDTHDLDGDGDTTEPLPYDLDRTLRFVDHAQADSGNGLPPLVDLGAYETPWLWIAKTVTPRVLDVGERLTYTLIFSNHTGITATNVLITDVVRAPELGRDWISAITVISSGVTITDTGASPAYVWQVQDLPPGEGGAITITGVLSPSVGRGQTISNTMYAHTIFSGTSGVIAANAPVSRYGADLALSKRVNDSQPYAGDTITYTLSVANLGPDDTTGVEIDDTLPPGVTYVSSYPTRGYIVGDSAWRINTLRAGESATLDLVALVDVPAPDRNHITNTAVISASDQPDDLTGNNTASAVIEPAHADLALTKTGSLHPVLVGTRLTYTLAITNQGTITTAGVMLTDTLPVSVSFVATSPGCSHTGGTITCTVGNLASLATRTFTVTVTTPATGALITNTALVTGDEPDHDLSNNTATEPTWVSAEANLDVDKRDSDDPVLAGTTLTYTLVVTNHGPDAAGRVVLTDVLPSGVSFAGPVLALNLDEDAGATQFEDDSGFEHHAACITCPVAGVSGRYSQAVQFDGVDDYIALPDLPGHDELSVGMWVNVTALPLTDTIASIIHHDGWDSPGQIHMHLLRDGRLQFTVYGNAPATYQSVFAFGTDVPLGQWVHLVYVYDTVHKSFALYIDGALDVEGTYTTAYPGTLGPGRIGSWNPLPTLPGWHERWFDGLIDEVVIYDRALSDLEIAALYQNSLRDQRLAASQGTCTFPDATELACDLGTMVPGAVITITLPVRVNSAQTETFTNTVSVSGYVTDSVSFNNTAVETTTVQVQVDLALAKVADPDPALIGIPITYTVAITNYGPSDARNVLLTDTLQGAFTWGTIATTHGSCGAESGDTFTCTLGTIKGGSLAHVTLVVTPTAVGTLTNTVRITGDEPDPISINNAVTRTTEVGEIDLALSKTANANRLYEGDTVTYTIVLTNHGPSAATSAIVSDALPGGISFGAHIATHGAYTPTTGIWNVGALDVGQVATLTITGAVGPGTIAQTLTNTAILSASQPVDIITPNNSASAAITVIDDDLSINKTVDNPTTKPGDAITYTITFSNVGNSIATGVIITDRLPVSVTNASFSSSGAQITATGAISYVWDVEDLNVGEWGVITITGVLSNSLAAGPFTNTATITSALADSDPSNNSASAKVTVENVAPVLAAIGNRTVDEGSLLSFTATATDNNDDTLAFGLLDAPDGAVIDSASGDFNWTPTEAQGPGAYTLTVVVSDTVITDSERIAITVNEINQAPALASIGNQTVDEGTVLTFTASTIDSDLPVQTLSYSLLDAPGGAAIGSSSSDFSWTPTEGQGPGTYTLTVIVSDTVITDSERIAITVHEVNQAPALASIGNQTVDEGTVLTFTASATDSDLPVQPLSYSLLDAPGGATIDSSSGVFSWTPSEAQGPGVYTLTVVVSDTVITDSERIAITVHEVNQAPALNAIGNQTIDEETELTFSASATDSDLPAQTLSYSLLDAPDGAAIESASGDFGWTPTEAQGPGVYTLTVVVSDTVITDSERIVITVNEVNRAPTISNILNQSTDAGVTVGPLPFTVGDAETDAASLILSTASSNQGLLPDGNIALGGSGANRTLFLAPATGLTGTATITVTVSDGTPFPNGALTAYDTFILAVGVNAPPEFTSTPVETATVGMPYTYTVTAYDADPGDALIITAPISATWLTLTQVTTRTASLSGTPTAAGDYPVELQVTDGEDVASLTETQTFTISVTANSFPGLRVFKSVDTGGQSQVPVGGIVTYTIVISNSGTGVASGVVMTDPLPSGVSFGGWVGGHPGIVTLPEPDTLDWRGDVGAGVEYALVFSATVGAEAGGAVVNTAYYRSDGVDLKTASDAGFTVESGYDVYLPLVLKN